MKDRCYRQNSPAFKDYGGRGITMCESWRQAFVAFLNDVGLRPSPQHSIDRIDNNRGYEPQNVRWALPKEQNNNTRANRRVTHDGQTRTVSEWAALLGTNCHVLIGRFKSGWTVERALTTPVR